MKQIRVYESFLIAQFAAEYLRAHGVAAMALESSLVNEVLSFSRKPHNARIFIAKGVDPVEASRLLDEFDANPPQMEEGWEDQETEPDLSRLDLSKLPGKVKPMCPRCGYALAGLGDEGECPECGAAFDLVSLIVHAFGPEVLEDCYGPGERPDLAHAELVPVSCARCGVSLVGQPQAGACPHCGEGYDKRELLERLRGRS